MSKAKLVMEDWDISRLKPYENNAKIHTKEQVEKIARSIKKHGLANPPNVEPDGTIITGHGRHAALQTLGWEKIPVFVRYDLNKAEAAALRLSDNKVAEGASDTKMIESELRWLESELDIDLFDIGFDERELSFLTEDIGELDIGLLEADSTLESHGIAAEHETEMEIERAETEKVAIAKVIGFKDISRHGSRVLTRFMATVCDEVGEDDPEKALVEFAERFMNEE